MVCSTFADRVSLTWCGGKYKRTIPLGSNNVPLLRSSSGYNNSSNICVSNQWSPTSINAYNAFIPTEYELSNEHPQIPIPITIEKSWSRNQNSVSADQMRNSYYYLLFTVCTHNSLITPRSMI